MEGKGINNNKSKIISQTQNVGNYTGSQMAGQGGGPGAGQIWLSGETMMEA